MDTFDYKPNSFKSKSEKETRPAERQKLEKVVKGEVKTKKKSGAEKIASKFLAEDVKNVKTHLIDDVVIPAVKKTIVDFIKEGVDALIWGSSRRDNRSSVVDRVSYGNYYNNQTRYPVADSRPRASFDYDRIVLTDKGEAEMVLARLDEVIATYGHARVSDLYDLLGMTCDFTCNDYGWTNLSTARTVSVRGGGYGFDLPRALPIHR